MKPPLRKPISIIAIVIAMSISVMPTAVIAGAVPISRRRR